MLGSSLLFPLLLLAPSTLAQDSQLPTPSSIPSLQSLKLYHRLTRSSSSQESTSEWKERATLKVDLSDDTVQLEQLSEAWDELDLSRYGAEDEKKGARYELSLRREGENEESSGWVSVRPVSLSLSLLSR